MIERLADAFAGGAMGGFIAFMSGWYWFDRMEWTWARGGALVGALLGLLVGRSFLDLLRRWFDWPIN